MDTIHQYLLHCNILFALILFSFSVSANELFIQKAEEYYVQGMDAYKQGRYEEAIKFFCASFDYNKLTGRKSLYRGFNINRWVASACHKLGNDNRASRLSNYYMYEPYDDGLTLYADSLYNQVKVFYRQGKYSEAIVYGEIYSNEYKKIVGDQHPDFAKTLNNLAHIYSANGDYNRARDLYQQANLIYKSVLGMKSKNYATTLSNLADIYMKLGDYAKAEPLCIEAMNICKSVLGEKHPAYATSLNSLASLYYDIGDYAKAEPLFQEAMNIYKEVSGENSSDYATSLNNLANLYDATGVYDKSELLYIESMNIKRSVLGENHPDYALSLNNLASLYIDLREYTKALPLLVESVRIGKNNLGENHPDYATSLNNLALLYQKMGDYSKAEPLYQESLKIRKEVIGDKHPDYATSLNNLASLYYNIGDNPKAEPYFLENYNLNKQLLEKGFSFMSERQRNQYYNKYEYKFNSSYPKYCYKYYPQKDSISCFAYDNELFIKGLLLNTSNSIQNSILESGDTALINKWNELRSVKERILKLQSQPLDKQAGMQELLSRAERLDKELTKASAAYRDVQAGWGVTWSDVQKKLGKNDVAVEFVDFQDTTDVVYYALVLRKEDRYPKLVPLFKGSEIDSVTSIFGSKAAVYNYFEEDSIHLYDVVWKSLEPYIAEGSGVYYSPTGVLHQMNIDAIPVSDSTRIGGIYKMVRLSSTRQLVTGKQERRETKATVYGGIRYDLDSEVMEAESGKYADSTYYASRAIEFSQDSTLRVGVNYLPGTKRESDEISVILKGSMERVSLMQDSVANEESFKALSGKHYNILHIATHGFFWPIEKAKDTDLFRARMIGMGDDDNQMVYRPLQDPMQRSGLILAGANLALRGGSEYIPRSVEDGILTAKEISNIDLRDADLVVLSACETGSGEVSGEGVFGLQRGFKQAGAQTIIMSLWKVDDKVTQELMERFYRNWTSGQTKREAFNAAVTAIRAEHPEPGYWAAFIMLD